MYKLSLSPFWLVAFLLFWLNIPPLWPQLSPFRRVAGDQILIDRSYRRLGYHRFDGSLGINWTLTRWLSFSSFLRFSPIKKLLGRIEMQTRTKKEWQSIQTVWDISRDDRARIATCSLRTDRRTDGRTETDRHTDRCNENCSIANIHFAWILTA